MIFASFQEYLPLDDLVKIVAVCIAVAVVAPSAVALVITGFENQAGAHQSGQTRFPGDARIVLGVVIIAVMIIVGIYAMTSK
jgi:heme/copper-type cytochrome/quinol oxidase subunit 2